MKKLALSLSSLTLLICGCGGSSSKTTVSTDFTLAAGPSSVSVMNGGTPQAVSVAVSAVNGFTGAVSVAVSGLPTGVTATPATLSVTPGQIGQFTLKAASATVSASAGTLTFTGTSGSLTHTATTTLAVTAGNTTATLSDTSFDFGGALLGMSVAKSVVTVTNSGSSDLSLAPSITGDASYTIVPTGSCGATLAAGMTCNENVSYTPTIASAGVAQTATLDLGLGNVDSGTLHTVALTAMSAAAPVGTVTATKNPQVAQYSVTLPFPGSMTVNFGTDTTYGRSTWSQSTSANGQTINMLVAGMLPLTTYHMQAIIQLAGGGTVTDSDHTFTTKATLLPIPLTMTTTAGAMPQPGVEEITMITGTKGFAVTDLQGGILWSYVAPNTEEIDSAKMLPNGHWLMIISDGQTATFNHSVLPPNNVVAVREMDLAGNIIRELTMADLNLELAAAGYNLTLDQFHHDITPLPNGHWIILASTEKAFTNLTGIPGTTNVLSDAVIDIDENLQPVWVWNAFDHLDINRHPYLFPDWTHSNAVVYSPSDGNLIISMRHQNWVIKVAYNDGAGNGNILWHLGVQGDFKLVGGSDPIDWNYAQHYPSFFSSNTSGIFKLGLMDNGDDRVGCLPTSSCPYTSIPVFQIDEGAKTATLVENHKLPPATLYSFFGGNTELLENGDVEYNLSATTNPTPGSDIFEETAGDSPTTIWHAHITGVYSYRGYRIPSLYPGVQW